MLCIRDGSCSGRLREVLLRGVAANPPIQSLLASDDFEPMVVACQPYTACYMMPQYVSFMLLRNPFLGQNKFALIKSETGIGEVFLFFQTEDRVLHYIRERG